MPNGLCCCFSAARMASLSSRAASHVHSDVGLQWWLPPLANPARYIYTLLSQSALLAVTSSNTSVKLHAPNRLDESSTHGLSQWGLHHWHFSRHKHTF